MKFFFKFFLATAALSLMQFANSYAETINKVQAKGNKRVSVESIVVFGDIEIGTNYEQKDVSLLIKKLYETNFFDSMLFLSLIRLGLIKFPPLTIAEYTEAACKGVVVMPWPKDTDSNLHLFHLIL